jgi:predicted transcriptional regulator
MPDNKYYTKNEKMAEKRIRTKKITIEQRQGAFTALFSRFRSQEKYESQEISMLRSLLSNEKARLLHVLKTKQPNSIYELAKILGRDFKSVRDDISQLEKFGFIELIPVHKGKREKLKPILVLDVLEVKLVL